MGFYFYHGVLIWVIIGFIIAFLLPGFWVILQGICEVMQRRNRRETERVPIEQNEEEGEALVKEMEKAA